MEETKYSIAVKLVGHDADIVQGYSVGRYLVGNNEIGLWLRDILESNDNNWLLGIVLRHPDLNKRRSNICVVRCGKRNRLLVTLDDAKVPSPGTFVPTISIDVFLTMIHGGSFIDDKIQEFGVLRDGSLFDHIRSGIDSGFNLGELRVYVHPNIHAVNEIYTDAVEGDRLVRFYFKPKSWNLSQNVLIDDLEQSVGNAGVPTASKEKILAPTNTAIADESNKGKKRQNLSSHNNVSLIRKRNVIAATTSSIGAKKTNIASASCFYTPFCTKLSRDCGGIKKGLCNEVNSGRTKIPCDEVFLEEKRKMKNKLKKERISLSKELNVAKPPNETLAKTEKLQISGHSTDTSVLFNPREYLLLYRAWNNALTETDINDTGKKYTEQDCKEASILLNDITGTFTKNEPHR